MVWDYVVVGSGFGGSVAALRLAEKGYRVLVLEKGARWAKEDFPKSTWNARKYLWSPRLGLRGFLQMTPFRRALVLSGVGVGGGSLVYGNTLFTPMKSFFQSDSIQALGGEKALAPFFLRASKMLGVVTNPHLTPMDEALRQTAREMGREHTFTASPVAICFDAKSGDPYFNGEGPVRTACTLCGGCFVGCRVGAKNTLDLNYLYFAQKHGAQVRAQTEVTGLSFVEDGNVCITLKNSKEKIVTKKLVLAAGVIGTLSLLLKEQARGVLPSASPTLGKRVLTNSEAIVAVRAPLGSEIDHSKGIAASSSVFPDENTQVQADRYPAGSDFMALLATPMISPALEKLTWIPTMLRYLMTVARHPFEYLTTWWPFGYSKISAILVVMQNRESYLNLGHRRGLISLPVPPEFQAPATLPEANSFARHMAKKLGGMALSTWTEVWLGAPVTAHVMGGCRIHPDPKQGGVDLQGRLHGHEQILVCDGSIIPANLGVNPALTILALTEFLMDQIPAKHINHRDP
ncbi:MAG: hypothetical protein A2X86_10495 [Bdellovibrionales bacterium GWA2_49_15]|nr:MAG: hypothetical protein A2X86_10495 [Bdellovibrionales bacterium GWA2_49_15]